MHSAMRQHHTTTTKFLHKTNYDLDHASQSEQEVQSAWDAAAPEREIVTDIYYTINQQHSAKWPTSFPCGSLNSCNADAGDHSNSTMKAGTSAKHIVT
jgi:hypothetical protein